MVLSSARLRVLARDPEYIVGVATPRSSLVRGDRVALGLCLCFSFLKLDWGIFNVQSKVLKLEP